MFTDSEENTGKKTKQKQPKNTGPPRTLEAIHTVAEFPSTSQLSSVASCFHIITDEWAVLISLWLWETEPFRCDKGFMWC